MGTLQDGPRRARSQLEGLPSELLFRIFDSMSMDTKVELSLTSKMMAQRLRQSSPHREAVAVGSLLLARAFGDEPVVHAHVGNIVSRAGGGGRRSELITKLVSVAIMKTGSPGQFQDVLKQLSGLSRWTVDKTVLWFASLAVGNSWHIPSDVLDLLAETESPEAQRKLMVNCAKTGDLSGLKRLASHGLASGQGEELGCLGLMEDLYLEAAKHGHLDIIKCLIEDGLVPGGKIGANARNSGALVTAAERGDLETIKYLLESPHALPRCEANADSSRALRLPAEKGHLEVVKYLMESEHALPRCEA